MIKNVIKLLKSEYLTNVSIQVLGTGIAQIIPLLVMPILSRVYFEEDFAKYTAFIAVVSVLAVATGARYQYAIVLSKSIEEAKNVFLVSVYYNIVYSVILLFLSLVFHFFLKDYFELGNNIFWIPLYILFQGFYLSLINLSIFEKKFKINAFSKITQTSSNVITSLILGFINYSKGLIIGKIIGLLVSVLILLKKSGIKNFILSKDKIKVVSSKYIDFPKYNIIPSFFNTASTHAPVFFIGNFFSEQTLGYYGFAFMAIAGPISIISVSIKDVLYQKLSETFNNYNFKKVYKIYVNNLTFLIVISLPIIIILYFFGDFLFSFVFGKKWEASGTYTSILIFSFAIKLIVSPLSIIFNVTNKLRVLSKWQTIYLITTFLTLGISTMVFKVDIITFLKIYMTHELLMYLYYLILQFNLINQLLRK